MTLTVAISEFPFACFMYENGDFWLPIHFHANQNNFHMKGFEQGLVLKHRHKVIGKWRISISMSLAHTQH